MKRTITLDLRDYGLLVEMIQTLIINKRFRVLNTSHEARLQELLDTIKSNTKRV